ncbi:MAG: ABC transporter permease subunit, partial [Usitatibacter sp.]
MDLQLLISGVIFGLSIGSIFFLVSIGLSLCFGLMRVISLDQLLYYSLGAYITYSTSVASGSVWLGVLCGMLAAGAASFAVERSIFRRIYDRNATFSMITTFGILIGGIGLIKFVWGVVPRPVAMPMAMQVDVFGTDVPA